jgi:biopolymer transport protein ExbB
MTAIGLVVAVPAVMQYNWLMRRNKSIGEEMSRFANHIHGYLISGGTVRPSVAAPRAAAARPAAGTAASTGGAASTSKP